MLRLAAAALSLSMFVPPCTAQVTDAAVDEVIAAWRQTQKRSRDGKPDPAAAQALGELDVAKLSLAQVEKLCNVSLPQTADAEVKQRFRQRLQVEAPREDADGAVAAGLLVELVERTGDAPRGEQAEYQQKRLEALRAAATHKGLKAAIAAGRGTPLFLQVYFQRDAKAVSQAGVIAALLPLVSDEWPVAQVRHLLSFQDIASEPAGALEPQARERLRVITLGVTERALKSDSLPPRERSYFERRCDHLRGAEALSKLVGQPAPQVDFLWSNVEPAPKSLADFKGKIVVLDFWATWCVPCVATFPHLRELTERYRGLPVAIVGVTSLQGYVSHPAKVAGERARRTETKEPKDELALLGPWCKDMDVTWTAVVSKQDTFNPDFGIRSIPHVAIVDAEGRVRWNDVGGKAIEDRVDELLVAMGKQPPPRKAAPVRDGDR